MSDLIGARHDDRIACTDTVHPLTTINATIGVTWCRCGQVTLDGQHATWHERYIYDSSGRPTALLGYDRYVLGACRCHPDATHRQEADR